VIIIEMSAFKVGDIVTNGVTNYKITNYELTRMKSDGTLDISDIFTLDTLSGFTKVSAGGKRRTHKRSKKARKSRKARRHH